MKTHIDLLIGRSEKKKHANKTTPIMKGANLSDITRKIINGFDFEKYVSELTNRYKTFVIHKFMVY